MTLDGFSSGFKGVTLIHHEGCSDLTSKLTSQMCLLRGFQGDADARDLERSAGPKIGSSTSDHTDGIPMSSGEGQQSWWQKTGLAGPGACGEL